MVELLTLASRRARVWRQLGCAVGVRTLVGLRGAGEQLGDGPLRLHACRLGRVLAGAVYTRLLPRGHRINQESCTHAAAGTWGVVKILLSTTWNDCPLADIDDDQLIATIDTAFVPEASISCQPSPAIIPVSH